mmetsp:Transcript_9248/g.22303  ORF Transcript_9248/g.22303 Transcript_9248/m.22303 type:complete len:113 (+) Transcript_9248:167-505(+)
MRAASPPRAGAALLSPRVYTRSAALIHPSANTTSTPAAIRDALYDADHLAAATGGDRGAPSSHEERAGRANASPGMATKSSTPRPLSPGVRGSAILVGLSLLDGGNHGFAVR